jgi:hypothetical protein
MGQIVTYIVFLVFCIDDEKKTRVFAEQSKARAYKKKLEDQNLTCSDVLKRTLQ